tara:strand:- start:179 stop:508 length:330 start_codon:yes stop_codon:yes gene_type:complete
MSLLTDSYGASKEAKSIKYPSSLIHSFIEGCYVVFKDVKFKSDTIWTTDMIEICGCVMDGIREAVTLDEFINDWGGKLTPEQQSMTEMFGMLCTEQVIKEKLRNPKDPA